MWHVLCCAVLGCAALRCAALSGRYVHFKFEFLSWNKIIQYFSCSRLATPSIHFTRCCLLCCCCCCCLMLARMPPYMVASWRPCSTERCSLFFYFIFYSLRSLLLPLSFVRNAHFFYLLFPFLLSSSSFSSRLQLLDVFKSCCNAVQYNTMAPPGRHDPSSLNLKWQQQQQQQLVAMMATIASARSAD